MGLWLRGQRHIRFCSAAAGVGGVPACPRVHHHDISAPSHQPSATTNEGGRTRPALPSLPYSSHSLYSIAILVNALQQHEIRNPSSLFNQCACVAGALLMASLWSPLFTERGAELVDAFVLAISLRFCWSSPPQRSNDERRRGGARGCDSGSPGASM